MATAEEPQSIKVASEVLEKQVPQLGNSATAGVDLQDTSSPLTPAATSVALKEHPQYVVAPDTT
jgi:hypothetical protein